MSSTFDAGGLTRRGFLVASGLAATTGLLAACSSGTGSQAPSSSTGPSGSPKKGGVFRIGVEDASAKDNLDPALAFSSFATFACRCLYDSLVKEKPDGSQFDSLATEFTPNDDATVWTIRIRDDVTFHDGKPLTIDDVLFSIERAKATTGSLASQNIAALEPSGMQKVDEHTATLTLTYPDAFFKQGFSHPSLSIVPRGFDPAKPVGSGPFTFKSVRSMFFSAERNPEYWGQVPWLDAVEVVGFDDPNTARMNALLSGQIDAMSNVTFTQARQVEATSSLALLSAPGASFEPFTMRVDQKPFTDRNVRDAFKLMIDREQLVKNVYDGRGRIGNDLGWIQDPFYAADIPQREHDPDKAKSLLKKAGYEGLKIDLWPIPELPWNVSAAEAYAQQAKAAGVDITLQRAADLSSFWDKIYLQATFSQSGYGPNPLSVAAGYALLPDSPYNEAHWSDPKATELFRLAQAAGDEEKRRGYLTDFQQIVHDDSGWIVWGFRDSLQAVNKKFAGLEPSVRGVNQYDLTTVWMV